MDPVTYMWRFSLLVQQSSGLECKRRTSVSMLLRNVDNIRAVDPYLCPVMDSLKWIYESFTKRPFSWR